MTKLYYITIAIALCMTTQTVYAQTGTSTGTTTRPQLRQQRDEMNDQIRKDRLEMNQKIESDRKTMNQTIRDGRSTLKMGSTTPAEMKAFNEKVKKEREAFREEASSTRRAFNDQAKQQRSQMRQLMLTQAFTVIKNRLDATVQRLGAIIVKLDSRISIIKTNGGNTSDAEKFSELAKTDLSTATSQIASLVAPTTNDESAKETLKDQMDTIKETLRSAQENITLAIRSLAKLKQNVVPQTGTTTPATTTTTTN